jgi:hypothetical protein
VATKELIRMMLATFLETAKADALEELAKLADKTFTVLEALVKFERARRDAAKGPTP